MREIKFRFYNTQEKRMMTQYELAIRKLYDMLFSNDKKYVVMQCTGIKDKNGVDIYEEDIVKVVFAHSDSTYITNVYWGGEDYPAFDLNKSYMPDTYFDSNIFSFMKFTNEFTIEVIGNIYENPELLND